MKVNFTLVTFLILIVTIGCQRGAPSIAEEVYIDILTELELIFVVQSHTKDNELARELIDDLWRKYDVSEEDFLSSHFLYEKDIDGQIRRVQTIAERLTLKYFALEDSLGLRYLEDQN